MTDQTVAMPGATRPRRRLVFRHSLVVRLTHWIWVVSLTILFMSGLQIFNAHPSLNFGNTTTFKASESGITDNSGGAPLILDIDNDGDKGVTTILGHSFDTTGVLGVSTGPDGPAARAFPSWATLPASQDLATGRQWHFLFAWVLLINAAAYILYSVASGHFVRDIVPRLREYKTIPASIVAHLKLQFSHGPDEAQYNVLQKLAYAVILFVVLPVLVLAGLEMSPAIDAAAPWLRDVFGGRQSARTIHFLMAWTLVAFVVVHVAMVVLSGLFNNLRSMITGYAAVKDEPR